MEVVEVPIKKIAIGNRGREELGSIGDLEESIKDKGILQPITITPERKLIAGERRLRAALSAGMETVPCVIREVTGELDLREIELFENIHRKDLTWHERAEMEAKIYDLRKETGGMSERELAKELKVSKGSVNRRLQLARAIRVAPELKQCKTEDEAWKAISSIKEKAAVRELTKRQEGKRKSPLAKAIGDCYLIGDALEGMRATDACLFTFAEVDPPYGIDLNQMKMRSTKITEEDYREVPRREYAKFTLEVAQEVYRLLKNDAYCIWWFGPTQWDVVKPQLKKAGFKVQDIPAVWYKGGSGQSQQPNHYLANVYEPFFVCVKGKPMIHTPGRTNVFHYAPVAGSVKIHSTERPIPLITDILETFTYPSAHVLSPFLGSGNTIRAAVEKQMTCVGWDLNEIVKQKAILRAQTAEESA